MKRRSIRIAVSAALLGAACSTDEDVVSSRVPAFSGACPGDVLVLSQARLVDPERGAAAPSADLYVRGDRIVSREEAGPAARRPDCRINLEGGYVTPGLTDAHVHLEYFVDPTILKVFLASGVTTVRAMDGRPEQLAWRASTSSGELPGPRIIVGSPVFTSTSTADPDWIVVRDSADATARVQQAKAAGYDFIKVYHSLAATAWEAVAAGAAAAGLPVAGHLPQGADLTTRMLTVEHLDGFSDAVVSHPEIKPWDWRARINALPLDEKKLATLIAALRQNGTALVPTLTALDWRFTDPAHRGRLDRRPSVARLPQKARDAWARTATRQGARMDAADHAAVASGLQQSRRLVMLADRGGVPVLAGTDTPQTYVVPGEGLIDELEHYVAAGLSPARAIHAATLAPARVWGLTDSGCLRPGCRADFLVTRGNPLREIDALREPELVGYSGRLIGRETIADWRTSLRAEHVVVPGQNPPPAN